MQTIEKADMSGTCGFGYQEFWMAANHYKTMSQTDWINWLDDYCYKCKYMNEICMYGED